MLYEFLDSGSNPGLILWFIFLRVHDVQHVMEGFGKTNQILYYKVIALYQQGSPNFFLQNHQQMFVNQILRNHVWKKNISCSQY